MRASHAKTSIPTSTVRPKSLPPSVRSQAAIMRALLDELERAPLEGDGLDGQIVEELARLGCRCLDLASDLTHVVDAQDGLRPGGASRCA